MIGAYIASTWVDDDGSNTVGTLVTAERMNGIEQASADASLRTRIVRAATLANQPLNGPAGYVPNRDGDSPPFYSGIVIDDVAINNGERVLLAGQTDPKANGVYYAAYMGGGITAASYNLYRAEDFSTPDQIKLGQAILTSEGTFNAGRTFLVGVDAPAVDAAPITIVPGGTARIPFLSALPTKPVDGQEIYFVADPVLGVVWHLRFRAASVSPFKWEYVGGPALRSERVGPTAWLTSENTTSIFYTTLATVGPLLTAPLAGEYECAGTVGAKHAVAGNLAGFMFWLPGDPTTVSWNDGDAVMVPGSNGGGGTIHARRLRTFTAGQTVELRYASSTGSSAAQFFNRNLYLTPVRVG